MMKNLFFSLIFLIFLFGAGLLFGSVNSNVPGNPRIIVLVPSLHEILFELGLGEQIVATSRFAKYPSVSAGIPKVGGLVDLNLEAIVALRPDVILADSSEMFLQRKSLLEKNGTRLIFMRTETIGDIYRNINELGKIFGREDKAAELIRQIQDSIGYYSDLVRALQKDERRYFLLVISRPIGKFADIYVAGTKTFLSELLEGCGLVNLAPFDGYKPMTLEFFLQRNPSWVIEVHSEIASEQSENYEKEWKQFWINRPTAPEIIILKGDYVSIPGPRIYQIVKQFYQILIQKQK